MNVKQLRESLKNAPDDAEILASGGHDHSYRTFRFFSLTTVAKGDRTFAEWAGPENASPGEHPVKAVVLS